MRARRARLFARGAAIALLAIAACGAANAAPREPTAPAPTLGIRVVRTLPHDVAHYTQGLVLYEGKMIESAGRYGRSALYLKDLADGRVLREIALPRAEFAEGATLLGDRVFQLTWREGVAHVYAARDFARLATLRYAGEGWGITHDGRSLITSDGSAWLRWRAPRDFSVTRQVQVLDGGRAIELLNELEYARGLVFANVWMTERIALVDPATGTVRAWVDLAPLKQRFRRPPGWSEGDHVLNGIAWDAARDRFYVTGKCWPVMFELAIDPLRD